MSLDRHLAGAAHLKFRCSLVRVQPDFAMKPTRASGLAGSSGQLLGGKIERGKQYHGNHQHHDNKPEALARMGLTRFAIYETVKHGTLYTFKRPLDL